MMEGIPVQFATSFVWSQVKRNNEIMRLVEEAAGFEALTGPSPAKRASQWMLRQANALVCSLSRSEAPACESVQA